ncbi:GMC family oxidoreductase [Bailinhaonella thermotolerans]|uniref:Cholesterol oxidase n=1 Tax=Bailinhaonella thermotolerans TaxID=1070861 RepID=A0A3A4B1M5_9ACTN|nr:GMC family oxidoreductase [Bailinhaonella thermotolerans]
MVIIGSGVGGSIAAFRFARAGIENVVLERGRRWPIRPGGGTFPSLTRPDHRLLWLDGRPPVQALDHLPLLSPLIRTATAALPRYPGLLEVLVADTLVILCSAGVGGTTLSYAGMLPQPRPEVFHRVFGGSLDYGELDRTYYPRARRRMRATPFPDDVLRHTRYRSDRLFGEAARAAGLDVERLDLGFDFDVIRAELDGRVKPSASVGDYLLTGCDSGAKTSMDRTYLARAEATGRTKVRPLHRVTAIAANRDGTFRVSADRLDLAGRVVERAVLTCDKLVMAAGAVHTPRLLVTARDTGALPRLNEHVGGDWGTNGDQAPTIKTLLAGTGAPQGGPPAFIARNADATASIENVPLPLPVDAGAMLCLGMGLPDRLGRWHHDAANGRARLAWTPGSDATAGRETGRLAARTARHIPGGGVVVNPSAVYAITAHPLGGAVLGRATDPYGRLHGYRGLYCLDGALMPGSTAAVNPALTIAAVAERCLDHILRHDFPTA